MAAILTVLQSIFTAVLAMAGDVVTFITAAGNELILMFCLIPLVGIGVGMLTRLIRARG